MEIERINPGIYRTHIVPLQVYKIGAESFHVLGFSNERDIPKEIINSTSYVYKINGIDDTSWTGAACDESEINYIVSFKEINFDTIDRIAVSDKKKFMEAFMNWYNYELLNLDSTKKGFMKGLGIADEND